MGCFPNTPCSNFSCLSDDEKGKMDLNPKTKRVLKLNVILLILVFVSKSYSKETSERKYMDFDMDPETSSG